MRRNTKPKYEISKYSIKVHGDISHPFRAVIVSDLHEREYEKILKILRKIKPDYIFLPGDTLERELASFEKKYRFGSDSKLWQMTCFLIKILGLNRHNKKYLNSDNGVQFLEEISKIASVYMSVGNHEHYFSVRDLEVIKRCNIHLLNNSQEKLDNGVIIGGVSTVYNLDWFREFSEEPGSKILLCHHPEYYQEFTELGIDMEKIDLVISGHAHGGQIRILDQGIFAPGQGLLPKKTKGMYGNHLVSSGASNTAFVPRLNNPPEICLIKVK